MPNGSERAMTPSRGARGRRIARIAAGALLVGLHAWLAFEVLAQPLDAGSAPPCERAPTWWLSNDSVHRDGPGADLFAVYHAGIASARGTELYSRYESPPITPYFFPFRYLPIVAQTLGDRLVRLSPRDAYLAWGLAIEAFVLVALLLVLRVARTGNERLFGVAILSLAAPVFLELHMGQLTFATAVLAMGAALLGDRAPPDRARPGWRASASRLAEAALLTGAALLKLFPLAALPAWLKRRRWGICAAAVAILAIGNLPYFSSSPGELAAFAASNLGSPRGGLDAGNFSPAYVLYLLAKAAGLVGDDGAFLAGAGTAHLLVLSSTMIVVLLSRERRLWFGAATLMLAHFAGYVHVWEHHASAVLFIGLIVWLKRRDLASPPGRAWSAAVAACLVLLASPTPFALLDGDFQPAQWDPSVGWSLAAKLLLASSKAVPVAGLWALLVLAHVRAGLSLPWTGGRTPWRLGAISPATRAALPSVCLPLAVLTVLIAFFSLRSQAVWTGFPLDDAWIHRVYARAVATGYGFQYNAGADEVGATSPLWIVVTAPAEWLGGISTDAVAIAVKAISVLLAAAFVLGALAVTRAVFDVHPVIAALPAAIVAADPRMAFSLLSGMESVLVAALWIWAVFAALRRRWAALACLAALLPLARPEAVLLLPAAWIAILLASNERAARKAILLPITLIPAALWAAFCWRTTGHPLPTTFYVKADAVWDVASIAGTSVRAVAASGYGSTVAFPAGVLGFAAWWWSRRRAAGIAGLLLLVLPIAYALSVSASRHVRLDGYYWTRWYDPAAFLLNAASAFGLVWSMHRLWRAARELRPLRPSLAAGAIAGLILLAAGCALSFVQLARSVRAERDRLASDVSVIDRMNVAAGKWIERHARKDQVVGTNDAGAVKYFGRRPTIDLGGLNYHPLAFDWSLAEDVLRRSSWLVVFPKRLEGTRALRGFEEETSFSVTPEEYTICDCPQQTVMAIYKRNGVSERR
jgi:hypothetical protein